MAKLAEIKTRQSEASVMDFLNNIEDEKKRLDSLEIYKLMSEITKEEGKIWGDSIIGFKNFVVSSPSGREVEWFRLGFSPRKNYISLYLNLELQTPEINKVAKQLGKVKLGRGCINFNKLETLNKEILNQLIEMSLQEN